MDRGGSWCGGSGSGQTAPGSVGEDVGLSEVVAGVDRAAKFEDMCMLSAMGGTMDSLL